MSDDIWFQKVINAHDGFDGFWMCPTPNCDGAGFTFDIFPTDPDHPANQGWTEDEDGESIDLDQEDAWSDIHPHNAGTSESGADNSGAGGSGTEDSGDEYDPAESAYADWDQPFGADDDDLEGEEWKHGLAPGERPPQLPFPEQARRELEQEQQRYNAPDLRPRIVDWSDRPAPSPRDPGSDSSDSDINDSDIPF
jgi:hypothetical protein